MLIICIFLVQHGRKSTREYQTCYLSRCTIPTIFFVSYVLTRY